MKKPPFYFRCVGFQEVFSLLDLDQYDEILVGKLVGGSGDLNQDERPVEGLIEVFEKQDEKYQYKKSNGKSLGIMDIQVARDKFL